MAETARPRLAILSLSTLRGDARVLREIHHAAARYDVTVVGWGELDETPEHVRVVPIARHHFGRLGRAVQVALVAGGRVAPVLWRRWYWRKPDHRIALHALVDAAPDVIHANESIALPIALRAAERTGARVLFDAHEYSLDHWTGGAWAGRLAAPLHRWLVTAHAGRADAMVTVADGLAARYAEALGLPCGVILNAPGARDVAFRATDPERVTLIHHGVALRARRLEDLVETVALCPERYRLRLMLVPKDAGYLDDLRALAEARAPGRVAFDPPVTPEAIVPTIRDADIGLAMIPPADTSYLHCLPNKFFDFLHAGLAVATGPSPEMAGIVTREGAGIVAPDFTPAAMAAVLASWSPDAIDAAKRNALATARRYNAEREMARLGAIYDALLTGTDTDTDIDIGPLLQPVAAGLTNVGPDSQPGLDSEPDAALDPARPPTSHQEPAARP